MSSKFSVIGRLDKWKKGDLPLGQTVAIVLNSYTTKNNGEITLTSELAADSEIDFEVDRLIKDLESARKKAKANLKKTNEKIRASYEVTEE